VAAVLHLLSIYAVKVICPPELTGGGTGACGATGAGGGAGMVWLSQVRERAMFCEVVMQIDCPHTVPVPEKEVHPEGELQDETVHTFPMGAPLEVQ